MVETGAAWTAVEIQLKKTTRAFKREEETIGVAIYRLFEKKAETDDFLIQKGKY